MTAWIAFAGAGLGALVLGTLLLSGRRREKALAQALSRSNDNLEHLEQSFARFAPPDVVEKLSAGASEIPPDR